MQLTFTPAAGRDGGYSQALPIKIAHNPAGKEIRCSAVGTTPRVALSQQSITCGPTLPNGQAEASLQVSHAIGCCACLPAAQSSAEQKQ